ncbi:hypothetical protein Cni_G28509 [Canna indica]|uniref:Uncharacterized protein n=1 Tax=Canna indica TaxID=4628 RepID=A0AAQ3L2N1_9LILI|nr:hypothetical protein Cni_G28509 [Canna indica]
METERCSGIGGLEASGTEHDSDVAVAFFYDANTAAWQRSVVLDLEEVESRKMSSSQYKGVVGSADLREALVRHQLQAPRGPLGGIRGRGDGALVPDLALQGRDRRHAPQAHLPRRTAAEQAV